MMTANYVQSIADLQAKCHSRGYGFDIRIVTGVSVIDHARNILVNRFLEETDCTHLFFVDDDMGFNVDGVIDMFDWAHEADVIGVIAPKRSLNWSRIKSIVLAHPDIDPAHLANLGGDYEGMFAMPDNAQAFTVGPKPVRVDALGTGLMLISRACFIKLRHAADPIQADAVGEKGYPYFRSEPGLGEDVAFCRLVRSHGGTILGMTHIPVTHSGAYDFVGDLPGIARYS
jgi:hypothetical protein